MPSNRRELVVAIVSDASQYSKGFDRAKRKTQDFARTADQASKGGLGRLDGRAKAITASFRGMGALFAGGALVGGVRAAVGQAEALNSQYEITEQVIRQTGGAANVTAEEIRNLSREQAFLTGISKQTVLEGNNVLLTFKNLRNEVGEGNDVFDRASQLMLDVSATMGTDAKSAALQLGKALNDPVSQMGALSRAGLTFTQSQKDQIKALVASGELLSAQKLILDELESQLGGTAEASADSSARIARAFDEIAEAGGKALLPLVDTAAELTGELVGAITHLERLGRITGFDAGSVELAAGAIVLLSDQLDSAFGGRDEALDNVDRFAEGIGRILDESELTVPELQRLDRNVDNLRDTFGLTTRESEILSEAIRSRLGAAYAESAQQAEGYAGDVNAARQALQDTGDTAEETADQVSNATFTNPSLASLGEHLIASRNAARELRIAILELTNPFFAAGRAGDRVASAEEALAEAEASRDPAAIAEAKLDLADANLEAQGTREQLQQLYELNPRGFLQALDAIGQSLEGNRDDAIDLLETLGVLDGLRVRAVVELEFETGPPPPLNEIINGRPGVTIPRIPALPPELVAGVGHSGGIVPGTRGSDQLILAAGGETILPTHQSGFARNVELNVNVAGDVTDQAVEDIGRELLLASVGRWAEVN